VNDALTNARKHFPRRHEVIVADNGSTDGSLKIIKKIKQVRLINVPVKGYGAALHWGILASRGEYVCFADADLSYPFSNLSKFKAPLKRNPDLLLGSRLTGTIQKGAMPALHRYIGTPVLTILIRLLYGIPATDCNSGMRVVKRSFYSRLNMRNSGMEWASELLLKTALKNGKYLEVPIRFNRDQRNRPPHLSRWSDGWRHLKAILLLKPTSLYLILAAFLLLALLLYSVSFALSFLFLLLSAVLFLSILALHLLESVIEKKYTRISQFLNEFRLVPLTSIISLILVGFIYLVPDERLGTKLFIASLTSVIFMWIFLIETIKTHLVNRLPDA